jgi:ribosomal protein L37AE/L43A
MLGYRMEEKQGNGRLRTCCQYCGSLHIYKVKSLRIYRCYSCKQSFVVPSTRFVESYKSNLLKLSDGQEKQKDERIIAESI